MKKYIQQSSTFCRLCFFTLLILCSLNIAAQNPEQKTTIRLQNVSVKDLIKYVENNTTFTAVYRDVLVDDKKDITVNEVDKPLSFILRKHLEPRGLRVIFNKGVLIITRSTVENTTVSTPKLKKISGLVTDDKGDPIIGASVVLKGSNTGTVTSINGDFSIEGTFKSVITVSYVGYKQVSIPVESQDNIRIVLQENNKELDEIIVVGYGVQKRSDLTGAISSITSEKINMTPSTNIGELIRGSASGVKVTLSSAAPGGSSSILIRGRRSLSGANNPLFIVDGVPMGTIDDINSNDIASLEVLKDASSQSIYGARAANGVILITTKRGVSGKLKVDYTSYVAQQTIKRNFELYNGEEWMAYRREAFLNGSNPNVSNSLTDEIMASGKFVDWEQEMIHPAFQHKQDISIQTGTEQTKYSLGLGYYSQLGMIETSGFDRLTGRLNIDHKLTKNITLGSNISYTKSWRNSADGSFNSFITTPPVAKIFNDDGSMRLDVTGLGETHTNPLWNINNAESLTEAENTLINFFTDWKILKGLSYRLNASLISRTERDNIYKGMLNTAAKTLGGKASIQNDFYSEYLLENIFNYTKEFNENNRIDATMMQSVNVIQSKTVGITGSGFANDDLSYHGISTANEFGTPTWYKSDRKLISYMGRLRYSLLNRYLFTASVRIDGSSVFGVNNKFGYFPSGAFAWRINNEQFMADVKWLSNLKLRLSYGQVGNQGISPYQTLGLADRHINEFGNDNKQVGYLPGPQLTNPNLKWETSTTTNTGVDFGIFNQRISGSIELYSTQTKDMLVERSISQTLGYSSQLVNIGQVENKGIEISVSALAIDRDKFSWTINGSFSANRNKLIAITGQKDENGKPVDDINNNWFIGQPISVYYDYQFDGIWQKGDDIANSAMKSASPGSIKVKDINEDEKIDDKDRGIILRDPLWFGSIGNTLKFRSFDLAMDMYFSYGGIIRNPYLSDFSFGGDLTGKRNGLKRDYWTENNPSTTSPAPNSAQPPAYLTSLSYQDASYFRIRNITVGYTIPVNISQKISLERLRVYATVTNLFTYSKVYSYSPEQNPGAYPEAHTALLGLNVSF